MRKTTLCIVIALSAFSIRIKAQVGINTPNPTATLDVIAKNPTGVSTEVDGLLIPRVDRARAQNMTSISTSTMIYVNNVATGTQTGIASNIDVVGYYYYDGSLWTKLKASVNIYNSDGTITGNRIANTAGNSLTFVNGANNIIIGTAGTQGIVSTTGSSRGAFQANGGAGVLNMFVDNGSSAQITTSGSSTSMNLNTIAANPINILTNNTNRMTVTGTGNVGVGTQTPQKTVHVNGSLQIVDELNVGGSAAAAGSAGTTGQVLTSAGAGAAPSWQTLNTASGTYCLC